MVFRYKFLLYLLISFSILSPVIVNSAEPDEPPVKKLVIASSNNFPPINTLDRDGNLTGFAHDLSTAVAKALNLEVEYIHSSNWKQVLGWLTSKKADLIHDTGYTKERDKFLDYTLPIFTMDEVIFVHSETLNINSFESLTHKKVACVNNHITHHYLKKFTDINCYIVNTPAEGLAALINKNVDAFIYPKEIVSYLSQQLALSEHIKITGQPVRTLEWSMTVNEGNQQLINLLNKGISIIKHNGEYDKIYQKWFGEKLFSGYSKEQIYLFISILVVSTILLTLLIGSLIYLYKMRKVQNILSQSERKYRELTKEYNLVTSTVPDIMYKIDTDGRLQWWNKRLETVTGLTAHELTNKNVLDLFPIEVRSDIQQAMHKVFSTGYNEIKAPFITTHGNVLYDFNASRLLNNKNQTSGLSGTGRDISQHEKIRKEHEDLQSQLFQIQKMESIGHLTGGIAHDFNNMLASIIGFADLSLMIVKNDNNPKLEKYLNEIYKSGERASKLVQQMLAFSRKQHIDKDHINLHDVIKDSLEILRPTIPAYIRLNYQPGENIPLVYGNNVQIEQSIINLCINARDAIGNKSGEITIKLERQEDVNLTCDSCGSAFGGDYISLTVSDNGSGIPGELVDKIFYPFITSKNIGEGSGMGLSMIHGSVHSHDGHILMDTSSSGTSFSIYLPVISQL